MTVVEKATDAGNLLWCIGSLSEHQLDSARPNCFNCPLTGFKSELMEPLFTTICSPTWKTAVSFFCWWCN